MFLTLTPENDFPIVNEYGIRLSVDDAASLWNAGKVDDCNLHFVRLIGADFDMDAMRMFYRERSKRTLTIA